MVTTVLTHYLILGMIVVLKYPYYRDVSEPDIYETATVHTEVGRLNTLDTQSHAPVAVSYVLLYMY